MRFDDVDLPRGPAAHGELRLRAVGQEKIVPCDGLEIDSGGTIQLFNSACRRRSLSIGEYVIEQRSPDRSTEHTCCVSCAVKSDAVGTVVMEWEIARLLQSDKGVRLLADHRTLNRFPDEFTTDIIDEILDEARKLMERGERINTPYGWCRHRLGLLTKRITSRGTKELLYVGDTSDIPEDAIDNPGAAADRHRIDDRLQRILYEPTEGPERLEAMRSALARLGHDSWRHAAVLALLAFGEGAQPGQGCPQPDQGARPATKANRAALWYSGQRDVLAELDGVSELARRKRIERLVVAVHATFQQASARVSDA